MNGWAVFFLGVIAVATLATAILQVGLIVYTGRLMRRLTAAVDEFERELKPLVATANAIGRDAARVASLAVSQMERADQLFASVATRVEETAATVQDTILGPAREGKALWAGLRTAIAVLLRIRGRSQEKRTEDEESLFI
jgi:hypothetical protein